ncbi:tetratricopeptide repeat protein [Paractinoplanes ovalisporus]|uniref:tetratricopeptide repeat protein n=1 Tax=Paractinoplanes ovalisporus TaxID=2810368 RepID=UPI0027DBD74E|nr:tetratricopeptide repeat protein [Actinoplanes ovalisporus]
MDLTVLPDPGTATTLDALVERLRSLKLYAGDPSYETITDRVRGQWSSQGEGRPVAKSTVSDCFRPGRRRLNADLVLAVVRALHPDEDYVAAWRRALQMISAETVAAAQVRVEDSLPADLAVFTGRTAELDRLHHVLSERRGTGGAVVISAIEGMAGVGKTQLAVHAAHRLLRQRTADRVLFVNLRGFHPDPAQPPADPAAVLDGFLRLLGVPGPEIPHDRDGRAAAYRGRLAGTRTLVVLDNAAGAEQVRPLLPETPGCPALVTSRRDLSDLDPATRLAVDVFTAEEAGQFLSSAAPRITVGDDPDAAARVAERCGYLPLALGLLAGHMRARPGWTLTDHADRLDDHHRNRRLETGIELALDLSYLDLEPDGQRVLRLLALHPGQDLDAYTAAALAGTGLDTARAHLRRLAGDHLLQPGVPGRYTFHDLVRAYATTRSHDEDSPPERRAALTRLFDHYLATAAAAVDTLHPGDAHLRPRIPRPGTPNPDLSDPDTARAWLDDTRAALVTVAVHTATHGWHTHATRLSRVLFRYLSGGHNADAVTVHSHAHQAGRRSGDAHGQAHALTDLSVTELRLSQHAAAVDHLEQARELFRRTGDRTGEARALNNLGAVQHLSGHYRVAADHYAAALELYRQTGDGIGEARALANLGNVEGRLGRQRAAADHYARALALYREAGDRAGEAYTLNNLGNAEVLSGRLEAGGDHLEQSLALHRLLGDRNGQASTLDSLGTLHLRLGQPARAVEHYQQALVIARENSDRYTEAWALNGLGEAASAAARPADAVTQHRAAYEVAAGIDDREQQARAHAGLGLAYRVLDDQSRAREHYEQALAVYTDLGMPEADQIRAALP